MTPPPEWRWNEMAQVGTDFTDLAEVEAYEREHSRFRDFDAENRQILGLLDMDADSTLVEMGCGTGRFTRAVAPVCRHVHAVDVSPTMLAYARSKAETAGLANVTYHHAGFLTYEHAADPVDAVVSQIALHHLPDTWKLVALGRIHAMLKPGGRFCLRDVVFRVTRETHADAFDGMVAGIGAKAGPKYADHMARHIRVEFSTLDWIMEGLLTRTGFRLLRIGYNGIVVEYLCVR